MPVYRFSIESPLTAQTVLQRLATLVREPPGFRQTVKESFGWRPEGSPPFVGRVEGDRFQMHRDTRYRNSFLPQVRGTVVPTPAGSTVLVAMHLHPLVAAFMLFWLGAIGVAAFAALKAPRGSMASALIPLAMFLFGVALTLGGFYPEAFKARRILEQAVGVAGAD